MELFYFILYIFYIALLYIVLSFSVQAVEDVTGLWKQFHLKCCCPKWPEPTLNSVTQWTAIH